MEYVKAGGFSGAALIHIGWSSTEAQVISQICDEGHLF